MGPVYRGVITLKSPEGTWLTGADINYDSAFGDWMREQLLGGSRTSDKKEAWPESKLTLSLPSGLDFVSLPGQRAHESEHVHPLLRVLSHFTPQLLSLPQ